jgi:hypothetical protein
MREGEKEGRERERERESVRALFGYTAYFQMKGKK